MNVTQDASIPALGVILNSADVEKGLRDLNPDFAFDVAVRRPGDFAPVLQFPSVDALENIRKNRLPVMLGDRYIVGMDRGVIPEFKQWSVVMRVVPVDWRCADEESASIQWVAVPQSHPQYQDWLTLAMLGSDPQFGLVNGKLVQQQAMAYRKVRGSVIRLGWRHTFEKLIASGIPGVTRESIAEKFKVDMMKFPMGAPDEILAELVEE